MCFCHISIIPSIFQNLTSKGTFFKISFKNWKCFAYFHIHFLCTCNLAIWCILHYCIFLRWLLQCFSTNFYSFYNTVFNMFTKHFYIIGIYSHFSIIICINFLCIVFRAFYYFMFGCLFFLAFALLLCVFANVFHAFLFAY